MEQTTRAILFKTGEPDKATELVFCDGLTAKFVQDISDTLISEAENNGPDEDFLAGVYFTMCEDENGVKNVRGVTTAAGESTVNTLLAQMIADYAIKQEAIEPRSYCGFICDLALRVVRERLKDTRQTQSGLILPDEKKKVVIAKKR